jgi:transposase InsO family protein
MCEILELQRSSYYKWLNRKETDKEKLDQELCQIILEYHASFKGILGYRRMTKWINKFNKKHYNKKRIRRLMKLMGIASVIRRRRKGFIKSTPQITAGNVLNRQFEAEATNTKRLTDVNVSTKKAYLSAIIVLFLT